MKTFVAYQVALELVTDLKPIVETLSRHDSNLADQIKRASTSVVLNLSEGASRQKGNKRRAYEIANGEAREVVGCLDCAMAWGYIGDVMPVRAKLDRLLGLCWGLTHARR
jgi:four helix bundle protein